MTAAIEAPGGFLLTVMASRASTPTANAAARGQAPVRSSASTAAGEPILERMSAGRIEEERNHLGYQLRLLEAAGSQTFGEDSGIKIEIGLRPSGNEEDLLARDRCHSREHLVDGRRENGCQLPADAAEVGVGHLHTEDEDPRGVHSCAASAQKLQGAGSVAAQGRRVAVAKDDEVPRG